ncbi:DUF3800 domain-containing protein [Alkalicoccobacillus gibsonii]|uniref:DUF3800 domain-containing protein n=1 Tax=Alkalicoccobacillus gibsonii TaxID=79881 RepID=UPI001934B224|nr:DUF3800 domain-containing protein [Alkalicoccobacillus gibsonii]MBM0067931.1 DUF3800 domain-containing protein [Alkalicoccobacillus gibsonii]
MYIYLDDSGNIDSENGPLYVWAGFSIERGFKRLQDNLDEIFKNFPYKNGELKGKDATPLQKKAVFEKLMEWESLRICYIVVDKQLVTENQRSFTEATARNKEQSENYFLSKVINRIIEEPYSQRGRRAIISIDGSPARGNESKTRLHEYLSLRVNFPKWNNRFNWNNFDIKYNTQKNDRLMQTADFLANFILEYYKFMYYKDQRHPNDVRNNLELYHLIQPKIYHRVLGMPKTSLI